jgi:hypothetical protein
VLSSINSIRSVHLVQFRPDWLYRQELGVVVPDSGSFFFVYDHVPFPVGRDLCTGGESLWVVSARVRGRGGIFCEGCWAGEGVSAAATRVRA